MECIESVHHRLSDDDRQAIDHALALLKAAITGPVFDCPRDVKDYLTLRYADLEHEIFGVLWTNGSHRLIGEEVPFRGTLTQTSVYPREIVKQGLRLNAGGVILFHNHPSGCSEPSRTDELLTKSLKSALALVDIRLIDHIVVSMGGAVSLAERGLL